MFTIRRSAFTLTELLVAIMIATILVTVTVSLYNLIRTSISQDQAKAAAAQNARVAADRLSRELRQAPDVVTVLPTSPSNTTVTQPHEIEFEDGHANDLSYKRYYLVGTTLELQVKEYYFSSDPTQRVRWNAIGPGGVVPVSAVVSTQDVADMVQSLNFYENQTLLISITTGDGINQAYKLQSTIERRN
jgi:prepilin-type N-terminal cleavage/methylation domain-containing protein